MSRVAAAHSGGTSHVDPPGLAPGWCGAWSGALDTAESGWSDAVCVAEHARMDLEDERARRRLGQDWWQESPGVSAYDIVEPEDRFEGCHDGGF